MRLYIRRGVMTFKLAFVLGANLACIPEYPAENPFDPKTKQA